MKWLSTNYIWSAEAPEKWLWAITLANAGTTSILLVYIFAGIRLLVVGSIVSILPSAILLPLGIALLPLGIALSVAAFRLTKGVESCFSRRVAYVINGFALALVLPISLGLAALWLLSSGLVGKLSDMH